MIPDRRVVITMEHRDDAGWRPAVGGVGLGPWLDEDSAHFLVQWLAVTYAGMKAALLTIRVSWGLQEAMGLAPERPTWAALSASETDPEPGHRGAIKKPARGTLGRKVRAIGGGR